MIFINNNRRRNRELAAMQQQQQAYNAAYYGQPVPGAVPAQQINLYEQAANMRFDLRRQRREYIEKSLKERLPTALIVIPSLLLFALSVAMIAFEAIGQINNQYTTKSYTGFWCGGIYLILSILIFIFAFVRKYSYYQLIVILNSLSMAAGFVAFVISITMRYNTVATWLTYAIGACELAASILILLFIIIVPCFINAGRRRQFRTVGYYNNNYGLNPYNNGIYTMPSSYASAPPIQLQPMPQPQPQQPTTTTTTTFYDSQQQQQLPPPQTYQPIYPSL